MYCFQESAKEGAIRKISPKLGEVATRLKILEQLSICKFRQERLNVINETRPRIANGVLKDPILRRIAEFESLEEILNDDMNTLFYCERSVTFPVPLLKHLQMVWHIVLLVMMVRFFAAARNLLDVTRDEDLQRTGRFDMDDVVLTTVSRLDTPIWKRRRVREGYDAIFIDETDLFNMNELSVFTIVRRRARSSRLLSPWIARRLRGSRLGRVRRGRSSVSVDWTKRRRRGDAT